MPETYECYLCESKFEYGPHEHGGARLRVYEVDICRECYDGCRGGVPLHYEKKLLARLDELDIDKPERNEDRLITIQKYGV